MRPDPRKLEAVNDATIQVYSIFGYDDRKPYVDMVAFGKLIQMDPETARQLALNLLQAAEAALGDEMFWTFLVKEIGLDEQVAARGLVRLRNAREQNEEESAAAKDQRGRK